MYILLDDLRNLQLYILFWLKKSCVFPEILDFNITYTLDEY